MWIDSGGGSRARGGRHRVPLGEREPSWEPGGLREHGPEPEGRGPGPGRLPMCPLRILPPLRAHRPRPGSPGPHPPDQPGRPGRSPSGRPSPLPSDCEYSPDPVGSAEPFHAFSSSLELATRIRFPWRLDAVLDACHALFSGRATPRRKGKWSREVHLAAQLLAIVWYRHNHVLLDERERRRGHDLPPFHPSVEGREAGHPGVHRGLPEPDSGKRGSHGPGRASAGPPGRRRADLQGPVPGALPFGVHRSVKTQDLADAQTMAEGSPPGRHRHRSGGIPRRGGAGSSGS